MVRMWVLFFVGIAWASTDSYDADTVATQLVNKMTDTAGLDAATKLYRLTGFTINFTPRITAKWIVEPGRAASTGTWVKAGSATLEESKGNLLLTVPISINNFITNYTYDCSYPPTRPGTYDMSLSLSYGASIQIRITYDGPFNCVGTLYQVYLYDIPNCHSSSATLNFVGEGVNGPDQNCAYASWSQRGDYLTPFTKNFCASCYVPMKALIHQAAEAAIEGFNFCAM